MSNTSPMKDALEAELAYSNKRHKASQVEWSASADTSQFDILDEPGPLGLRLQKSSSLLNLFEKKLSKGSTVPVPVPVPVADAAQNKTSISAEKKQKGSAREKLKASNFEASLLRIGSWEYKPKYQGDLMAKFYFAKQKVVWEVLEGSLKNKIEIEWSDITGIKAVCPKSGLSTLTVVVKKQPSFFRELNPLPRKHTLWHATPDFTDGQCSQYRLHFLQCQPGLLAKHFEKLIFCDRRLKSLSRQEDIVLDSPYFDAQVSAANPNNPKGHNLNQVSGKGSTTSSIFQNIGSPQAPLSSCMTLNPLPIDVTSSSSAAPLHIAMECPSSDTSNALRANSRSTSDFAGELERCLSEEIISGIESNYKETLEDISQDLMNDNPQVPPPSDEKILMSKVNSFCCLLQTNIQNSSNSTAEGSSASVPNEENSKDASGCMEAQGMTRKDSYNDFFRQLPRIESLSKYAISDGEADDDDDYI